MIIGMPSVSQWFISPCKKKGWNLTKDGRNVVEIRVTKVHKVREPQISRDLRLDRAVRTRTCHVVASRWRNPHGGVRRRSRRTRRRWRPGWRAVARARTRARAWRGGPSWRGGTRTRRCHEVLAHLVLRLLLRRILVLLRRVTAVGGGVLT